MERESFVVVAKKMGRLRVFWQSSTYIGYSMMADTVGDMVNHLVFPCVSEIYGNGLSVIAKCFKNVKNRPSFYSPIH